ncbi:MAG: periplasmic heavy metal sensor [Proteobacteria bacterium]|nr:periplasmic heavy metal sensor [Pseudomonadota bacterium]MBU1737306.1 periplasmic heavy metal sensor [Pseudomonadota bacterium]
MKKVLVVALLVTLAGFTGLQTASAGWGWWGGEGRGNGPGNGPGSCGGPCAEEVSEEDQKARQEFFDATKDLRQQLFDKRSEYADVVNQENPDKEKAAAIWSEMYDLKAQLKEKADGAGFGPGTGKGFGRRAGCDGSGDCYSQNDQSGRGRGNGRGCNGPRW